MAKNAFWANVLTGGGATALDKIPGIKLQDLDLALVATANTLYPFVIDADDGGAESSPDKIAPDTNPGTKIWELLGIRAANLTIPQLNLIPSAAALSAVQGGMFYNSGDDHIYVCTEGG